MSDIRFNQWLHQSGTGGVSQDHIGNIGIGTTNPSIVVSAANTAVLNVGVITANNLFVNNAFNGDITGNVTGNISGATGTFSGNVDIADKIIHTGDTDTAMRFPADNTFAVDTAGSERLRITSAGLIGIGTVNPSGPIHAHVASGTQRSYLEASASHSFLRLKSGSTSYNSGLEFFSGASNIANVNGLGAGGLQFEVNGSERLRITSTGDVQARRARSNTAGDVALSIQPSDSTIHYGFRVDSANNNLNLDRVGTGNFVTITYDGKVGINCTPFGQFHVKTGTNANISMTTMSSEAAIEAYNDAGSANVPLRLRASAHKFFIGGTEGLRVHTNGLIGVGYDSPTAYGRMTVAMPSQSGGAAIQVANSSLGSGDGSTSNIVLRSVNNDASQWADAEYRASEHIFAIQGTERMRINANGYVTKSNQPRFFATRSSTYTGYNGQNTGGTWIAYDNLIYNVGGGFQNSGSDQGLFVAPVSGLYLFHAAAYKNTGTADWSQSWFNINSSRANGTDFVHASGTRFAQNAIQVYMTAGQKIGFHPYNNQINNEIITTGNHTWFKGCLLG